jgi:pSer/pThr/pTyr-binding forkhead associated (FHA) protein
VFLWETGAFSPEAGSDEVFTDTGEVSVQPTGHNPIVLEVKADSAEPGSSAISLGRSDSNDVVVHNPGVSRMHALIHADERRNEWHITDAGSRNGTVVDGVRVRREQSVTLRDGAVVVMGDVRLLFLLPESFVMYLEARVELWP